MVNLPPSKGFDMIMVVVDRFSKMAHFVPTKESATTKETKRLFFTHVFKHHGLLKDIVSNQNPKFTSKFWRTLWKCMGSKLKMNTSFQYKQMDRKNEIGYPTIPKEWCGNGPTRLGEPFGVGWVLLQQFGAFGNKSHPISNGDKKSPIVPTTWVTHGQPPNDVREEVPMVTQLDEER